MKRNILLGQKKSKWDLVDDLMDELKDENELTSETLMVVESDENPLWTTTEKDEPMFKEDSEELTIELKDTVQNYIDSEKPPVKKYLKKEEITDDEDGNIK